MKKTIYTLSALAIALAAWLAWLWTPAHDNGKEPVRETRYGMSEGVQLVEQDFAANGKRYVVEDGKRNVLFAIPLRHCIIDTRYRGGKLRFREQGTMREGYIDHRGLIAFIDGDKAMVPEQTATGTSATFAPSHAPTAQPQGHADQCPAGTKQPHTAQGGQYIPQVQLKDMAEGNPFYREAEKIVRGKLTEQDAGRRHAILNYCEHLRTAYTTKDIDFLRQVFSDKALIIVGNVVRNAATDGKCTAEPRVAYAIHSKHDYIARLAKVFAMNGKIDVRFSNFRIMRHPTMDGIYGVTLRQRYRSDRYSDDGYLFLLWDFRDRSMPVIHVRTWQPAPSVTDGDDMISIQDFNLQ